MHGKIPYAWKGLDPSNREFPAHTMSVCVGGREIPLLVLPGPHFQLMQTIFSLRSIAYGALNQP